MRERFLEADDFSGFSEHEVLEFMLSLIIVRQNTNKLAHELIERFGSLDEVLRADPSELVCVEGVGDRTAAFIKMQYDFMRYCYGNLITERDEAAKSTDEISAAVLEEVRKHIFRRNKEYMYLATISVKKKIKSIEKIAVGHEGVAAVTPKTIIKKCIDDAAGAVIIVHNHPYGDVTPSNEDLRFTQNINRALEYIDVKLIEHYIISETKVYPIIKNTSVGYDGFLKKNRML